MATSTLNIRVTPRRMLPLRDAAEYVGYVGAAAKRFPSLCPVTPIEMPDGSKLYDMRDLDAWLDGLKSGDASGDDALIGKLG